MAIVKRNNKCGEDAEKRETWCTAGGLEIGEATVETTVKIPQKIKNITTIWSGSSTPEYLSEETKNYFKNLYAPDIPSSIFIISKIWNQANCSFVHIWMERESSIYLSIIYVFMYLSTYLSAYTHAHTQIYTHHTGVVVNHWKKKGILPLGTTWIDLEGIILREISQGKTNTVCFNMYMSSEKQKKQKEYNRAKSESQTQRTNDRLSDISLGKMSLFGIIKGLQSSLQPWWAMCRSLHHKGRKMFLQGGKGSWEGYSKQVGQGFSLAQSLPGKKSLLSALWALLPSQDVRAPACLPVLFHWGFCLLIFYAL